MEETLQTLQSILDQGRRIVFFTGAGASTESGIPDFRSVDGLYRQQYDYRRRKSSVIIFSRRIQKSSTGFTAAACFIPTPGPTRSPLDGRAGKKPAGVWAS